MANKVVVGIDPDAEKFGVATYYNNTLIQLSKMTMPELIRDVTDYDETTEVLLSIEDVMANQFVYARNRQQSKGAESKIAMRIGRCQQSQVELMRWLDHIGIKYVLHKPQPGNWANNKELFERVTFWDRQSNEDTRAAAYFGYLAL